MKTWNTLLPWYHLTLACHQHFWWKWKTTGSGVDCVLFLKHQGTNIPGGNGRGWVEDLIRAYSRCWRDPPKKQSSPCRKKLQITAICIWKNERSQHLYRGSLLVESKKKGSNAKWEQVGLLSNIWSTWSHLRLGFHLQLLNKRNKQLFSHACVLKFV